MYNCGSGPCAELGIWNIAGSHAVVGLDGIGRVARDSAERPSWCFRRSPLDRSRRSLRNAVVGRSRGVVDVVNRVAYASTRLSERRHDAIRRMLRVPATSSAGRVTTARVAARLGFHHGIDHLGQ
jgi:hypothetical protein